ncbi:MAG: maleylacetate reductase [Oryzihumus sp.]
MPQRVVFGVGSFARVATELEALGARRVLLIASASAKTRADDLAHHLGDRLAARVHEVRQHVPQALADDTVALARDRDADAVATIGGGSATGLGKAVALATGLPLLAVPTTYAGSEATPVWGVTGEDKRTGRDLRALPRVVVYDAELLAGLPPATTATSGLNALAHCIEALWSPDATPVTDLLAAEAIHLLGRALPRATWNPGELADRDDTLLGAWLAGTVFAVAGGGLHHTLCHVLGGTWGLDHGATHAVLLPHVTAYNAAAAPEAVATVARELRADDAARGLWDLARTLAAPPSLAAIGMPAGGLDEAAERAVTAVGERNPRPVDVASLRRLLDDAFHGRAPCGSAPGPAG